VRIRVVLGGVLAVVAAGATALVAFTASAATNTYEAESAANTLAGGARAATCPSCSGGKKVGWVGNNAGTVQFNGVEAGATGAATLTIAYATGGTRSAQLSVNGDSPTTISFPSTGGFTTPGTVTAKVTLHTGANTLRFGNTTGWAPDFDRITVTTGGGPVPSDSVSPAPSSPAPSSAAPSSPAPSGNAVFEAQVVDLVNQERAKVGCQPLAVDGRLVAAARKHSSDMANRNYFSHTTPEGVDFATRISNEGYRWSGAAENIAKGQRTPAEVMSAWMNSTGHRNNILNCGYKHLGVGLAYDAGKTALWTQDFASPL
jgi:uncharacterized protein YkwD